MKVTKVYYERLESFTDRYGNERYGCEVTLGINDLPNEAFKCAMDQVAKQHDDRGDRSLELYRLKSQVDEQARTIAQQVARITELLDKNSAMTSLFAELKLKMQDMEIPF